MTKKSPETLAAILDTLASDVGTTYADAARSQGCGVNSFWHWVRASQLGRGPVVAFLGEAMPFFRAVECARRIAIANERAKIERRTLTYQPATFFEGVPEFEAVAEPVRRVAELDIDLDDLLGPEPVAAATSAEPAVPGEDQPPEPPIAEVVPDEPAPPVIPDSPAVIPDNREAPRGALVDAIPKKLSPLQEDLLAQLAALRAKNAARTAEATGGTPDAPASP